MKSLNINRAWTLIFSAILIGYRDFGLIIEGNIPYTQLKFSPTANIQLILLILVLFFGVQYFYNKISSNKKNKNYVDSFFIAIIVLIAIVPTIYEYLVNFGIDWTVMLAVLILIIAGLPWVIAFHFIIVILFSIRSNKEAQEKGLGRIPVA
jgi:hypothetical protein